MVTAKVRLTQAEKSGKHLNIKSKSLGEFVGRVLSERRTGFKILNALTGDIRILPIRDMIEVTYTKAGENLGRY